MRQERIVYIIPGFRQRPQNKAYKEIARVLKRQGYRPILINIPWSKTNILQNTEYFLKEFKKVNSRRKYILGFSFGAMIAFIASTKVSASGLILCSLSPYFKEDLSKADNCYQDFSRLHCASLAKQIKAKQILMLYGAKEAKSLIRRATEAFYKISSPDKYLIPIYKTEHDIGNKRYLDKIQQIAKVLN